jgi:hypothetical protein
MLADPKKSILFLPRADFYGFISGIFFANLKTKR